jgi:hypothetical protein
MTTLQTRVLELALIGLETEKRRIEDEITELRNRLGQTGYRAKLEIAPHNALRVKRISHNKGKKMSAAQKRKISQAMKARWASRKRMAA